MARWRGVMRKVPVPGRPVSLARSRLVGLQGAPANGAALAKCWAITLGLTATPTDIIDHNTFQLFHCEDGIPTFAYTYEEAVNNVPPYLCNFQVMKIQTKFQMEGISKRTISLEDQKKLILQGKEVEDINFEGSQLEKQVINKGTNTLIVREFMEEAIKDVNGVLPGKTIFFCATKAHARRMEDNLRTSSSAIPRRAGQSAGIGHPRVIRQGAARPVHNNEHAHACHQRGHVDYGIDVREIVNLVFANPFFPIPILARWSACTRLLEQRKPKRGALEKDVFLILDVLGNFEFSSSTPKARLKTAIALPVRWSAAPNKIEKAKRQWTRTTLPP
ncbi:hypothetical protein FQR65_LT20708 [Abscondita terminalis]|nr:hypothetical protein FQR65_LT20708 [Abscondita terminalis]